MIDMSGKTIRLLAGLGFLAATTGMAQAESYDTVELGLTHDRETCMSKAEYVLFRYKNQNGSGKVTRANWVVYGWDLRPGDQDVVIMCPIVNGVVDAFLVVHSEGTESNRDYTVDEIRMMWDQ